MWTIKFNNGQTAQIETSDALALSKKVQAVYPKAFGVRDDGFLLFPHESIMGHKIKFYSSREAAENAEPKDDSQVVAWVEYQNDKKTLHADFRGEVVVNDVRLSVIGHEVFNGIEHWLVIGITGARGGYVPVDLCEMPGVE